MKLVARTHQTLVWDRSRQPLRLRSTLHSTLREFFPAALRAFDDLTAPDALHLLGAAPDPDRAARLSRTEIIAGLNLAHRRSAAAKATHIQDLPHPGPAARRPARPERSGAGCLRCDRDHPGPAHHRPQHRDRAPGAGGGRPFWPTPGR
jgi:hypothetical protein